MRAVALAVALCCCALVANGSPESVAYKPDSPKIPMRKLPFAGNGTCGERHVDEATGITTVTCLGPKHLLSPGQTIDTMMLLESPYPTDEVVLVINQTSQMVDDNLRPVPLSELYVHHYGGGFEFLVGSGAELRGSFTRKPLPEPYAQLVNGTEVAGFAKRMTNIQLINTVGLPTEKAKSCLECWCDHDPWHTHPFDSPLGEARPHHDRGDPTGNHTRPQTRAGSLLCCHQCDSDTPMAGPIGYHLQYTITYRSLKPDEAPKKTMPLVFDVVGGGFEYQIDGPNSPGNFHLRTYEMPFDKHCPQKTPVEIVRCTGHQHFGGQCLELIDLDNNQRICNTCPVFGTQPGVPGDEEGYVVRIPDDDLETPYTLKPGTRVQIRSKYDASIPRFGVMGLAFAWVAGMSEPCNYFGGENGSMQAANALPIDVVHTPQYYMNVPMHYMEEAAPSFSVS